MFPLVLAVAAYAQSPPPVTQSKPPEPPPPASIPKDKVLFQAVDEESSGSLHTLRGNAWVETDRVLVRADYLDWDEDTGDIHASGHVHMTDFKTRDDLWCDRLEYNSETGSGKFYHVIGQSQPRIVARPGMLTSANPLHFEGEWAERVGGQYVVHNGFVTNCKVPAPWWRLKGPKFVVEPHEKVQAYWPVFYLKGVPLFVTPYFFHSLQKEPRKSGFLLPNVGNSSQRGVLFGLGYFWAINQSHDITYRVLDYTGRGYAHHVEINGKPRQGTNYYAILYGVQDRGRQGSNPVQKFSGISVHGAGESDLGRGWTAHFDVNYLSSLRFRQEWSQSYSDLVGSEIHSVGYLNRNWNGYSFNAVFARLENFQSTEIPVFDAESGTTKYLANAVSIRKLPEANLSMRDRAFWRKLPVWVSFDSSAGLLYRYEPVFNTEQTQLTDRFQTGQFMLRENLAPRVTGVVHLGAFHLTPSVALYKTYYGEAQQPYLDRYRIVGNNIVRSAAEFNLDMIFPTFERVYTKKTIFGDKLKHVIEPRATFKYVTGVGTDFDKFIRFDETELLSNTNELLLSITNRVYAKRGDSVEELLTWTVMQKRYFDPTFGGALQPGQRNVFESTAELSPFAFVAGIRGVSPVVSSLRISPIGRLGVRWQADYDPRAHGIVDSTLALDYRWRRYFVMASNNEVHVDPALSVPAANQYGFRAGFGDVNRHGFNGYIDGAYDYRARAIQHSTAQISYNTDCCGLSFQYYRYRFGIRDETQYRIAFSVANIGTFGNLKKQDRMF